MIKALWRPPWWVSCAITAFASIFINRWPRSLIALAERLDEKAYPKCQCHGLWVCPDGRN